MVKLSKLKIKKEDYIFFSIVFAVIIIDQITKFLIRNYFAVNQILFILDHMLYFTYLQNTGAGFGIFKNSIAVLIWISVIVIGVVLYFYDKIPKLASALILGGTIGNLIDRIFLGYVVDFIDFRIWPAFNVADSCLFIGVILLAINFFIKKEEKYHKSSYK